MKHSDRKFRAAVVAACIAAAFSPAAFSQQSSQQPKENVYKVGSGVSAPRVISKVDPDYTKDASAAKISGTVLLQLVVGSDGVARDIQVVRGLDPGLDANAIRAVQNWRFQPGAKDGQAVSVRANIEVNFRLE